MKTRLPLRKILLNTHLYGGLLCFSYLIIFGISSLNFNHPFEFTQTSSPPTTWQQSVSVPDLQPIPAGTSVPNRRALISQNDAAVRRALGLFGYPLFFKSGWKDSGTYRSGLSRPGKTYAIEVHPAQNLATVTETRTGIWRIIKQLHGFSGELPGSALVSTWSWYTELCVFTVLFSAASGIYLWTRRRNERRAGILMLSTAAALSLALMLYITFHG